MQDPRLAEIKFLMKLERDGQMTLLVAPADEHGKPLDACELDEHGKPLDQDAADWYRLGVDRFRAMMLDLILREFVVGDHIYRELPEDSLSVTYNTDRLNLAAQLLRRKPMTVYLSHAGRVHLWNQRDALMRDPDLDSFGLRSKAAWDRDLSLRLLWATQSTPLSIMFIDIDHFKRVNDTHGHLVGDEVLRAVFGLVGSVIGTCGTVYRWGGEEVGVILPGIGRASAADLAEQIRKAIEREVRVQVKALDAPLTVSIGVAEFAVPIEKNEAVNRVDGLTYQAKQAGRNRVVVDSE